MKTIRNSSIEVLRIISILFIIASHYCVHGGFDVLNMNFSLNKVLLQCFTLGNIGVVIFVMITGYFNSTSTFKLKKLFKIIYQTSFYSIIIYLLFVFTGFESFNLIKAIKNFFPIVFDQYWFMTCYIILYILSPYLNKFICNLSKKDFKLLLLILFFLWAIVPTFTLQHLYGNQIAQFILFYLIGAYIRKFGFEYSKKTSIYIILISFIMIILSIISLNYLAEYINFFNRGIHFLERNSILVIILSANILYYFSNIEFHSKFVNILASTTLGIYLIHDNSLIRTVLWTNILKTNYYKLSNVLVLHLILSTFSIYFICFLIEYIRIHYMDKIIINKHIKSLYFKVESYFITIKNKLCNIF